MSVVYTDADRPTSSEQPPVSGTTCNRTVKPMLSLRSTPKPEVRRRHRPLRHHADRKYRDDDVIKTANMAAVERRLVANARERRRMMMLNEAFDQLRAAVPLVTSGRRLSKYDTLQLAQCYISALHDLLNN